jgi:hypothetical protein
MEEQSNPIEEARQIVNELKIAKEELRQLLTAIQNEKAGEILSGKAEAGQIPAPPAVETPAEYKNRVLSGKI